MKQIVEENLKYSLSRSNLLKAFTLSTPAVFLIPASANVELRSVRTQNQMTGLLVSTAKTPCKLSAYFLLLLSFLMTAPANAQNEEPDESFEPDNYVISPGGVNMATGRFRYESVDLDSGAGGLSLARMTGPPAEVLPSTTAFDDNPMGQFTHNWNIRMRQFIDRSESAGYIDDRHIEIGDRRHLIPGITPPQPCPITPSLGVGRQLMRWSSCTINLGGTNNDRIKYYVTGIEFGRIEFDTGIHGYCREDDLYCAASKLTRPDGTVFALEYDVVLSRPRLRRVNSNRGFSLIFLYGGTGPLAASPTEICLVNSSVHSSNGSYVCPSGVQKVSYSYSSDKHMSSFTDAAGQIHQYATTYNASSHQANRVGYSWTEQYIRSGESAPYLTNTIKRPIGYEETIAQTFADGRSIAYTWDLLDLPNSPYFSLAGGTYQESGSPAVTVEYDRYDDWPAYINDIAKFPADGPTRIVDELGREIVADQCEPEDPNPYDPWVYCQKGGRLQSLTMPEGNRIEYEYSSFVAPKPTTIRRIAKPNSGQQDIVQTAGGYNCLIYFLCRSPQFEVDGRGNRTDYVYSTVHGGILSKTGPAVNGVRPETRYTYAQKYAWLKSVSGWVQATSPVWVLASEQFCRTSAADANGNCGAGASDEVTTTYEYQQGSGSKGSNIFLIGTAVTADGQTLRTCSTYGEYGRKISETRPKGVAGVCP